MLILILRLNDAAIFYWSVSFTSLTARTVLVQVPNYVS